jgi:hypothetical protein
MKKRHLLFSLVLLAVSSIKTFAQAQPCYTDEVYKKMVAQHPEILKLEADFNEQVKKEVKKIDLSKYARTTVDQYGNEDFWYDIPIVVHVIHDYNNAQYAGMGPSGIGDYLTDNMIYNDLIDWNIVYAGANSDTSNVIPTFKPYIGIPHIRLHLASIDPNGHPTHGITRDRSYLTYIGGDQSKISDWDPTSYVNIWTVNVMSLSNAAAAAYAYFPSEGAVIPSGDGIICLYNYLSNDYTGPFSVSKTINHEMGHVFSLYHPWGSTNNPEVACGDDSVDDTPPTHGHLLEGCAYNSTALYDTDCASNYFKIYASATPFADSIVKYPDTTNAQNIMDYTYCARMFTKQQVDRMHAAMNSTLAGRSNLWDSTNLEATGVTQIDPATGLVTFRPRLDLKPIPEFNATYPYTSGINYSTINTYMNKLDFFTFPGNNVLFTNQTWNDTVTNLAWTFSNGASVSTSTSLTSVTTNFSMPGWVTVGMTATGNNTGDTTVTWQRAVFVADNTGTSADGYAMEFNNSDTTKWPMFNYYNNDFKWQLANVGYYDNSCIQYVGYDSRVIFTPTAAIVPATGNPIGDVDDFFSVPMDLSSFSDTCNLNFFYSAASRSSNSLDINDTLEIDYSVNKGTWKVLKYLSKGSLINKGVVTTPYIPAGQSDWAPQTIGIPAAARTNYVTFRFRYRPNVTAPDAGGNSYSSGNNFYMDHINFSRIPAAVSNVVLNTTDVVVVPNPTNGDAYVVIKDAANANVQISVSDITGKIVYTTQGIANNGDLRMQIPHAAISVKGIYIIQTVTGNQVRTQKLVVE